MAEFVVPVRLVLEEADLNRQIQQISARASQAAQNPFQSGLPLQRMQAQLEQLSAAWARNLQQQNAFRNAQSQFNTSVRQGEAAFRAYGSAMGQIPNSIAAAARAQAAFVSPLQKQADLTRGMTLSTQVFGAGLKDMTTGFSTLTPAVSSTNQVLEKGRGVIDSNTAAVDKGGKSWLGYIKQAFLVAPAFTLAYNTIRLVESAITSLVSELTSGIKKLDAFKIETIEVAGILATITKNIDPTNFQTFLDFAEDARLKLELLGAQSVATGAEIFRGFLELTERGVILQTRKDFEDLINLVQTVSLVTKGTGKPIQQVGQEIRLILEGTIRPGAELIQLMKGIDSTTIETLRSLRTMEERAQFVFKFFEPFKQVQEEINETLLRQTKLTRTIFDIIERQGATIIYQKIVDLLKQFNESLFDGVRFSEKANTIATAIAQSLELVLNLGLLLVDAVKLIAAGFTSTNTLVDGSVSKLTLTLDIFNRLVLLTRAMVQAFTVLIRLATSFQEALFKGFIETFRLRPFEGVKAMANAFKDVTKQLQEIGTLTESALDFSKLSFDAIDVDVNLVFEKADAEKLQQKIKDLLTGNKQLGIDISVIPDFDVDNTALNRFLEGLIADLTISRLQVIPLSIEIKDESIRAFETKIRALESFEVNIQPTIQVLKPGEVSFFVDDLKAKLKSLTSLPSDSFLTGIVRQAETDLSLLSSTAESVSENVFHSMSEITTPFLDIQNETGRTVLGFGVLRKSALDFSNDAIVAVAEVETALENLYEILKESQFFKLAIDIDTKNLVLKAQLAATKGIIDPDEARRVADLTAEYVKQGQALLNDRAALIASTTAGKEQEIQLDALLDRYGESIRKLDENAEMQKLLEGRFDKTTGAVNKQKTAAESLVQTYQKLQEAAAGEFESPFIKVLNEFRDLQKKIADAGKFAENVPAILEQFKTTSIANVVKEVFDFNKALEDSNRLAVIKGDITQQNLSQSNEVITALINEQEQLYVINQLREIGNKIWAETPELLNLLKQALDELTGKIRDNTEEIVINNKAVEEMEKWQERISGSVQRTKDALEDSQNALTALNLAQANNLPITDDVIKALTEWVELHQELNKAIESSNQGAIENARANLERFTETLNNTFKLEQAKQNFIDFTKILEDFAEEAAKNIQDAFSDFFFNAFSGKLDSFKDVWKSFLDALLKTLANFIALAIVQLLHLEKILKSIFSGQQLNLGSFVGSLGGSGGGGGTLGQAGGVASSVLPLIGGMGGAGIAGTIGGIPIAEGALIAGQTGIAGAGAGAGILATIASWIPYIGAALAVLSFIIPLLSDLFKKTPRFAFKFESVETELGERAALVSEFLDADFFSEEIFQKIVGRGGKGAFSGKKLDPLKEAIQKAIEETIESVQAIINKLPTDMADILNETLLNTAVDTETKLGRSDLLGFDAKGAKNIKEKLEKFFQGDLQARFLFSVRDFFQAAFEALGTLPAEAERILNEEFEKFKNAGSPEARAKIGEELLALFNAYVDVFNIAVGNVNDPITAKINQIKALTDDLGLNAQESTVVIKDLATEIGAVGKSTIPTLPELQAYAASIIETGNVSPETAEKLLALRQAIIDLHTGLAQAIADLVALAQHANEQLVALGGSLIDFSAPLAAAIADLMNLLDQGGLSPAEQQSILSQLSGLVDAWVAEQQRQQAAVIEAQRAALQSRIDALQKEKSAVQDSFRAQIDALEEMKGIAEELENLARDIHDNIIDLQASSKSPESVFQRLARVNAEVSTLFAQLQTAPEAEKADIGRRIQELLNTTIDIGGEVLQRPSGEFRELFDDTIRQLEALQALVGPARSSEEIQASIEELNKKMEASLASIDARIESLQQQQADLASKQLGLSEEAAAQAKAYYQYIEDKAIALIEERLKQLAEIGVDGNSALSATEQLLDTSNDLLSQIRDALFAQNEAKGISSTPTESYQGGGYIRAGQVQLGLLHGPEYIIPERNLANMFETLTRAVSASARNMDPTHFGFGTGYSGSGQKNGVNSGDSRNVNIYMPGISIGNVGAGVDEEKLKKLLKEVGAQNIKDLLIVLRADPTVRAALGLDKLSRMVKR